LGWHPAAMLATFSIRLRMLILKKEQPMPRHFYPGHHKHSFGRRRYHSLNSIVWIIGLWILFTTHSWWPGIMILVGITMVLNTFANSDWAAQAADRPAEVEESTPWQDWTHQPAPPPPPSPAPKPVANQPAVQLSTTIRK